MTIGSGLGGIKMTKKVNWSDAPKDADGVFFDTFIKFDSGKAFEWFGHLIAKAV